jgi:hypothetical protein
LPTRLPGREPDGFNMEQPQSTPRFPFAASAEVIRTDTHATETTRVNELSLHGCYLDPVTSLRRGAQVIVKIISGGQLFEASATVLRAVNIRRYSAVCSRAACSQNNVAPLKVASRPRRSARPVRFWPKPFYLVGRKTIAAVRRDSQYDLIRS